MYVYVDVCIYVCMYICALAQIDIHIYVYSIYIYIYMYVYTCGAQVHFVYVGAPAFSGHSSAKALAADARSRRKPGASR